MFNSFIIYMFYILCLLNVFFFIYLLFKKLIDKKKQNFKKEKREYFEEEINKYIFSEDENDFSKLDAALEMEVLEELLLEYSDIISGEGKERLLSISRQTGILGKNLELMHKRSWWKQAMGAYFIGQMEAEEGVPILLEKIDSEKEELAYIAKRSLIKISGTKYLEQIMEKEVHGSIKTKNRVMSLIDDTEEDIYSTMEKLFERENTFLSIIALESLGNRKDERVIPYIKKYIFNQEKELRISSIKAAMSIGDIGDDEYFWYLLKLETDESWEVRTFFAKLLGIFKRTESVDVLSTLLTDENWHVRFNSGESLLKQGEIGILTLSEMLLSEDKFASDRAFDIIQRETIFNNLEDRILLYGNCEKIMGNIEEFKNAKRAGVTYEF